MTTQTPSRQSGLRMRYSVRELQDQYDAGNTQPLEDLVRAWIGIKEADPDSYNSFFVIGGYHGEPFEGQGARDPAYWGGYCNHGNVLFPTWHRIYMLRLEDALRSVVPGVTMPYWDETSEETLARGIPRVLTDEKFVLDGQEIDNPLRSYVLQKSVNDAVTGDDNRYTKPPGYETVRYPLSGLVGTPEAREQTAIHNAQYPDPCENSKLLNDNVRAWLRGDDVSPTDPNPSSDGVYYKYWTCLDAPNYTAFSNTTSAAAWNNENAGATVVPVESPHNDVHLAVGGFDIPGQGEAGQIAGANGDMGENNTAGLDPIFFFHHCNVDRMFWLWQLKNGHTERIEIIDGYAGTSPNTLAEGGQGPAAGQDPNAPLSLDTPLKPFLRDLGDPNSYYTSRDCINSETQLGVAYSPGSLADFGAKALVAKAPVRRKLKVSGIDRSLFAGSFVIRAYAMIDGERRYLGRHAVLSRWNVATCANCQTHLSVTAFFDLPGFDDDMIETAKFDIEIQHRDGALPEGFSYDISIVD